jgi:hypothetical protein
MFITEAEAIILNEFTINFWRLKGRYSSFIADYGKRYLRITVS